jgi:hypothetical protein
MHEKELKSVAKLKNAYATETPWQLIPRRASERRRLGDGWATRLNPDYGTTPISRSDRMKRAFPAGVPDRSAAESGLRGSYDDRLD